MLLKTGIEKLDEMLKGGVSIDKSMLFYSLPGVDIVPFAYQTLYSALNQGCNVLYVINNKKADAVRFLLKSYDWDISDFEEKGQFAFFDSYTGLMGLESKERFSVKDVLDVKSIESELIKASEEMKGQGTLIVFDSLSSFLDLCKTPEEMFIFLKQFFSDMKNTNVGIACLFTEWAYDKELLDKIREFFDCVIDLKPIEKKVILRHYFSVSKANWIEERKGQEVPFKISKPGGVKVYIPKILVTGDYNAGKTSFIHSASTKAVSADRFGTTVAMDHGHVDFKGFAVDLWGTPGQERFDPILELLGSESLGVVVIVDSTSLKGFSRAKDMLEITKTEGLPLVIAANKSNMEGALKPGEVREKMNLPDEVPIVPIVADNLDEVKDNEPCKLRKEDIESVLSKIFEMVV